LWQRFLWWRRTSTTGAARVEGARAIGSLRAALDEVLLLPEVADSDQHLHTTAATAAATAEDLAQRRGSGDRRGGVGLNAMLVGGIGALSDAGRGGVRRGSTADVGL